MLKPQFMFDNITDISLEFLERQSIKGLLVDVDNTLTTAHASGILKNGVESWIQNMLSNGIKILILSNAKTKRIKPFAQKIGLEFQALSLKPLPFRYIKAAKKIKLKRKEIAIIGDQLFTDILGGNLAGVKTILVTDITPEDKLSFKIRRNLEKKILRGEK